MYLHTTSPLPSRPSVFHRYFASFLHVLTVLQSRSRDFCLSSLLFRGEIRRSISRDWLIVQTAIEARPRGRSVLINFFLRLHRDCHFRLQSEQSGRSWELARNYYSRRSNSRFIFSECIATLWYEVKIQIYVT